MHLLSTYYIMYLNNMSHLQEKAERVLNIIKTTSDDRECETKLVLLLGYDLFKVIKLVRQNKHLILYCTLRARAETEKERHEIEEEMRSTPAGAAILDELLGESKTNVGVVFLLFLIFVFL